MIYKKFQDLDLSALGVGSMRLPVIDGDDSRVDVEETAKMVEYALNNGINYFDTAYAYHAGNSETAMGEVLSKYPRESFYLATKFPGYDVSNMDKVEQIFEEQIKKCKVDYFDFYLFHNVYEKNIGPYLDEKFGIMDYLWKQKENGRIKHLGFSAHGSIEVIKRFLDAYGDRMEFGQLQLNYLDWDFQDAKAKVELLKEHNIPIWVMEPLRGGRLAKLSDEDTQKLNSLRSDESIPAWSFRFLQSIPEVTMVLSGMSNLEQLKENIETYKEEKPLNDTEMKELLEIAKNMVNAEVMSCTACRYCVSHCPKKLDIPDLLRLYNEFSFTKGGFIAPMAVEAMPSDKRPSACVGCKSCEAVCPQQLKISNAMSDFAGKLGF